MGACDDFCVENIDLARIIKESGRGSRAPGDLSRGDAQALFSAILAGRVPDLELGAILIALRVKGESLEELAGFAAACEASYAHLDASQTPVVIPSYNGARQLPNLVLLLALLLARRGVPVLIHGVTHDAGRVTTREVLDALGIAPARSIDEARTELDTRKLAFLPIETLAPAIARVLALREKLGVRNSAHTLAKMLQPFNGPALRIVSVTHPDYLTRMREYFTQHDSDALLLRGAEGEAVAHPRRDPSIEFASGGSVTTWKEDATARATADLPYRDAETTARWIEAALAGRAAVPAAIEHQVECCFRALAVLGASS